MRPVRQGAALLAALLLGAVGAGAQQVGYTPGQSPYRDLDYHQDVTAMVGWYHAKRDPVGIAPQSGLLTGLLYEWRAGGPAYLTGEFDRIASQRLVINPRNPPATRTVGTRSNPLYDVDLSLAVALTGFRSWHGVQPLVKGGLGMISDFKGTDVGGYDFGTRFAFSWGGGVRWIPGGRWAMRADVNNRLYTIGYPESYYTPPTAGGNPVLTPAQSRSLWTNNTALTIGISYQFSR